MQIVMTIDKNAARAQISQLLMLLRSANDVHKDSTYVRVNKAKDTLYEAKGMHRVLSELKVLDEASLIGEDIERIEIKIQSIYEEKRRKEYPKWRN